jgi:hypothetical protein
MGTQGPAKTPLPTAEIPFLDHPQAPGLCGIVPLRVEVTMKNYKVVNDTHYDARTPDEVIRILENARQGRYRLHISLGETDNDEGKIGRDWLEENMSYGYIGRSTGTQKIPLLVHNSRSFGGPGLLDHCIVRIRHTTGRRTVLWQHPDYHHGKITLYRLPVPINLPDGRTLTVGVDRDGQNQANFENMDKARRYIHKLGVQAELVNTVESALA